MAWNDVGFLKTFKFFFLIYIHFDPWSLRFIKIIYLKRVRKREDRLLSKFKPRNLANFEGSLLIVIPTHHGVGEKRSELGKLIGFYIWFVLGSFFQFRWFLTSKKWCPHDFSMHFRFFFLFLLHVSMHLRSWGKHVIMTIWLFCRFLFFSVWECNDHTTMNFPNGDLYVIISPLYERVCTWCRPSTEVKKGRHLCEVKHVLGFIRFGILNGKNRIYLKPRSLYPTNSNQVIRHVFCVWFWF